MSNPYNPYFVDTPKGGALSHVTSAALGKLREQERIEASVRSASEVGCTLREIALAGSMSHETVRRILKTPAS